MKIFAGAILLAVFSGMSSYSLADQRLSARGSAEHWADIAQMGMQAGRDHEFQAENGSKANDANSLEPGDLLAFSGDEKALASEDYRMASQQWEKAATAYKSAGDTGSAQKARDNIDIAMQAAKRALGDAVYFYMRAKEQYEATNNLDKKIKTLEKAARNLERLVEMKQAQGGY